MVSALQWCPGLWETLKKKVASGPPAGPKLNWGAISSRPNLISHELAHGLLQQTLQPELAPGACNLGQHL